MFQTESDPPLKIFETSSLHEATAFAKNLNLWYARFCPLDTHTLFFATKNEKPSLRRCIMEMSWSESFPYTAFLHKETISLILRGSRGIFCLKGKQILADICREVGPASFTAVELPCASSYWEGGDQWLKNAERYVFSKCLRHCCQHFRINAPWISRPPHASLCRPQCGALKKLFRYVTGQDLWKLPHCLLFAESLRLWLFPFFERATRPDMHVLKLFWMPFVLRYQLRLPQNSPVPLNWKWLQAPGSRPHLKTSANPLEQSRDT